MFARTITIIVVLAILFSSFTITLADPPRPIITDPALVDMDARTKEVQDLRFGMFICWSFSSFSGYEWTPGVDDVNFFNPTGFDPDQWVKTVKDSGMKYILFLTKHHDGFCLWNTDTTGRKVTKTKALEGVDVLDEVRKACDRHGIRLALYFSEGDWSWSGRKDIHTSVAKPEIKKAQLRELLTRYGPIEYIWFDHAVGDGGLNHADTAAFVKSIQPGCFVGFNHGDQSGADIRLGERGSAAPLDDTSAASIGSEKRASHMRGHSEFRLAEFTYPILEGQGRIGLRGAQWFYSLPENDNRCAKPEKIYRDYLGAVRFDNIFSLDVGPDRSGRIREIDVQTLKTVGEYIRGERTLPPPPIFEGLGTKITASSVWQDDPTYSATKAIDGNRSTRWGAAEESREGWIAVELPEAVTVESAIVVQGSFNRIESYQLQALIDGEWKTVAEGKTLTDEQKIEFSPVTSNQFRLEVTKASEVPSITEFQLFEHIDQ